MTYNVSTRHPIPEGCLTATCDLCGNGMYGGLADIYQSSEHGARPTRNLRLPGGGEYPAAQRASPSPRTRSRARRGPRICHPGRLRERGGPGRGRTGPGAADPGAGAERSPIGMAEVQRYMQWTSKEPAGGVMNRLRCGRISDSDGRSLPIAGPGQHAGPRHSTAPNGVRRGTPAGRGWTGSKAETHGGPGPRAGRRSKMYR